MAEFDPTLVARFWAQVLKVDDDGCWEWQGGKVGQGYGCWYVPRLGTIRTHRLAWELTHGPIPRGEGYHGMCVLHKCDNPPCVNPAHLFLGTNQDNMLDALRKGRVSNQQTRKTHCPAGHEYTAENTYLRSNEQHRRCRTCTSAQRKRARERIAAAIRETR